eukprot:TRINITY_DN7833_c0_g1_i2.p1 TRINITY_DN7833_c0_g1~~TRINITY_DN7833_c0_g1_i2.p1  ORF type:complete len:197 (+),score=24.58 TRINITY_DN7833_c0_g1_i2:291-881(+)
MDPNSPNDTWFTYSHFLHEEDDKDIAKTREREKANRRLTTLHSEAPQNLALNVRRLSNLARAANGPSAIQEGRPLFGNPGHNSSKFLKLAELQQQYNPLRFRKNIIQNNGQAPLKLQKKQEHEEASENITPDVAVSDRAGLVPGHKRVLYEPPKHSSRVIRKWEKVSGKSWYSLNPEERETANQEIERLGLNFMGN